MVTSRASGDDLVDDQDTRVSDIMASPRQPLGQSRGKPAAVKSPPATTASPDDAAFDGTGDGGVSPNGTPAGGKADARGKDALANGTSRPANGSTAAPGRPAAADDTIVDGVPALPADTIGSSRGTRPKGPDPHQETAGSKTAGSKAGSAAGDQSPAGDSPAFSFGPPPSAPAQPAVEDPTIAYPAESAAMPSGDDPFASPAPSGPAPSGPAVGTGSPAGTGSSAGASSSGTSSAGPSSGTGLPGRPPAASRPAPAEPSSVPPAAFAWEMPDPPPNSPSSPARTFLRSGTTGKNPAAAPKTASSPGSPPGLSVGAGKAAAAESPAAGRKAAQKAEAKRTARQAHLTVARVEPWSVMKFSFVVSLVAFVILFVAVSVLYGALSGLGVFDSLQRVVSSITSSQSSTGVNAKAWFSASKVLGYTALLGSLNIVLITAMSTIGAVVYNLTSRLVGGVEVTLRETE